MDTFKAIFFGLTLIALMIAARPVHADWWWENKVGKFVGYPDTPGKLWVLNTETGQLRFCTTNESHSSAHNCKIMRTDDIDPLGILTPEQRKKARKKKYGLE